MSDARPIRVMLVDDHKSLLWGLSKLIESEGPAMELVGTASNQVDAFALARAQSPDVVLLDIDLGEGVSSLDFLPDLVNEFAARVIILTGVREQEVHDLAVARGARGIVLKEEPAEKIIKAIRQVYAGEFWLGREAAGRAIERALHSSQQPAGKKVEGVADRFGELTLTELRVIEQIVKRPSDTNEEIADALGMAVKTLINHLTSVYDKLGIQSKNKRLDLFIYALKNGLAKL